MNYGIALSALIVSSVAASSAFAHKCPGDPGNGPPLDPGPKGKATILHCACADSGDRMEYVEIRISPKSRGHRKHVAGSIDSCAPEGSDEFLDFVRAGSDCQLDGPSMGEILSLCTDQVEGQECGTEVLD
jgi:hypothetical protein